MRRRRAGRGSARDARGRARSPARRPRPARPAPRPGSCSRTMCSTCAFSAWPTPDHHLLHRVRRVLGHRQPRLRRHQQRDAARLPELQRAGGVLVDEGLLDRRRLGPERQQHRGQRRVQAAEPRRERRRPPTRRPRSPHGGCRVPSTSTTPQPVRRSPGSIPMTRIGGPFCSLPRGCHSTKPEHPPSRSHRVMRPANAWRRCRNRRVVRTMRLRRPAYAQRPSRRHRPAAGRSQEEDENVRLRDHTARPFPLGAVTISRRRLGVERSWPSACAPGARAAPPRPSCAACPTPSSPTSACTAARSPTSPSSPAPPLTRQPAPAQHQRRPLRRFATVVHGGTVAPAAIDRAHARRLPRAACPTGSRRRPAPGARAISRRQPLAAARRGCWRRPGRRAPPARSRGWRKPAAVTQATRPAEPFAATLARAVSVASGSMSPAIARAGQTAAAAIASTPVPPPMSATRRATKPGRASRSSAIRQPCVVAWCPVPKACAASISSPIRFEPDRGRGRGCRRPRTARPRPASARRAPAPPSRGRRPAPPRSPARRAAAPAAPARRRRAARRKARRRPRAPMPSSWSCTSVASGAGSSSSSASRRRRRGRASPRRGGGAVERHGRPPVLGRPVRRRGGRPSSRRSPIGQLTPVPPMPQ